MRIFVSSSFVDLKEHRAAAIRVLRQLGHEVVAMEDLVAASTAPLGKVLEMVDRCEVYVGLFAWRYGYVPGRGKGRKQSGPAAAVKGAVPGRTSITHYEYLRAVERKLPVMAFLLSEEHPWPPHLIDGFDGTGENGAGDAGAIRALRQTLQQERVVAWFTTPSDLEARVSAAVTMAGLTRQLNLQPATALDARAGSASDSDAEGGIRDAILGARFGHRALKIDLATKWWSTRLYLIVALAERLTQVRRILVVQTEAGKERFVGQLSTNTILATIGPKCPGVARFQRWLGERPLAFQEMQSEIRELIAGWKTAFGDKPFQSLNEHKAKVDLTQEVLRRWFGDAMLEQPVPIADLQRATVVDLLRLLDYPNEFVPVLTRPAEGERVDVLDKNALNARLARSYLVELMDRARIG